MDGTDDAGTAMREKPISTTEPSSNEGELSSTRSSQIDYEMEKRVTRKLDMFLIPFIMILYIVSYLDRLNIGNAKIAGLPDDIGLTGNQFNVATSIFYVTYIVFDVPMTVLVRRYGPSLVLPIITIAWSVIVIFSGFIQNYAGLLAVRLLLGVFEAGLFPGLNFYISTMYTRKEISKRICTIFVALALSGAFGGLLAYAILKMDGVQGRDGWRWLFILEGITSFVIGVAAFWMLPDSPDAAYFLNHEERKCAKARLERDGSFSKDDPCLTWIPIRDALLSPMVWISGIIQLGANTYLFGFSIFMPTIIQAMGFNSVQAQYLTIPVYILGAICYFVVAIFADRLQKRFVFMMGGLVFVFVGYSVMLASTVQGILYMATFFVAAGGFIVPGLNMTWIGVNTAGPYKRAASIGLNQSIGNIGGVIAGQIFRPQDAPRYLIGSGTSIGGAGLAFFTSIIMFFYLRRKNSIKEVKLNEGLTHDGRGDESIHFKYVM